MYDRVWQNEANEERRPGYDNRKDHGDFQGGSGRRRGGLKSQSCAGQTSKFKEEAPVGSVAASGLSGEGQLTRKRGEGRTCHRQGKYLGKSQRLGFQVEAAIQEGGQDTQTWTRNQEPLTCEWEGGARDSESSFWAGGTGQPEPPLQDLRLGNKAGRYLMTVRRDGRTK